jgi:hypothetical protein
VTHAISAAKRNIRAARSVGDDMIATDFESAPFEPTTPRRGVQLRMAEFDQVSDARSVGEVLHAHLEDARAQLRFEQRLARRADRRVRDLSRAVENWQDLVDEYERVTRTTPSERRN